MSMTKWAEDEVRLACEREAPDRNDGEFDYGCACYESALKAFKSLMEDEHSGISFGFTKNILIRLMNGLPLTPIMGTDDEWNEVTDGEYQSKRRSSLFKEINEDGTISYSDIDGYICEDIENGHTYYFGLVSKIHKEMFPITFPYMPSNELPRYLCEEFLTGKENGDFDTVGIFYVKHPEAGRVDINRFFAASEDGWREIDRDEYQARYRKRIKEDAE